MDGGAWWCPTVDEGEQRWAVVDGGVLTVVGGVLTVVGSVLKVVGDGHK